MQKLQVYVVCLSPIFGHKVNTERIENCCSLVHLSWFSFDRTADSQQPSVALDGADNSSTYPELITSHTQLSRTHRFTHTVIQNPSLHTHSHPEPINPEPITSQTVVQSPSLHIHTHTHTHTVIHNPSLHTQLSTAHHFTHRVIHSPSLHRERERADQSPSLDIHSYLSPSLHTHSYPDTYFMHTEFRTVLGLLPEN